MSLTAVVRSSLVAVAIGVVACAGSSVGTVDGTVNGQSLSPADAVFYATTAQTTAVVLANAQQICGYFAQNETPKNSTSLVIYFLSQVTSTGTFSVTPTGIASDWTTTNATCVRTWLSGPMGFAAKKFTERTLCEVA